MNLELLLKYFPQLTENQQSLYNQSISLHKEWNDKINVISRKDIENIEERHYLHSLTLAHFHPLKPGQTVLDIGTGGGFPGIPLAIFYPDVQFTLVDSIRKKLTIIEDIVEKLELKNVQVKWERAEKIENKYDFVTARAVTELPVFYSWIKDKVRNKEGNGILYLKGGDFEEELKQIKHINQLFNLHDFVDLGFFETKKLVYIQMF